MSVRFTPLTGGGGCSLISAVPGPDLSANGFRESEYAASGLAWRYRPDGTGAHAVEPVGQAQFSTRITVRRPHTAAQFNGCVVVEWLNVSSGADAAPEYSFLAPEIIRGGYAWVGISAQYTGIAGGPGSVEGTPGGGLTGLVNSDEERYGRLFHPGDAYCWDIFGAVAQTLREPDDPRDPLSGLMIDRVLAVGESQSAFALTTYANVFQKRHNTFDGLLIHSRAAGSLPLGEVGGGIAVDDVFAHDPVTIRSDLDVPVIIAQTETDLLTNFRFDRARQPDSDRLRIWEMAGTAHADLTQIGEYESLLNCPTPVNRGQQRFTLRAALHHLHRWSQGIGSPPSAPGLHIDYSGATPEFVTDDVGNVLGGVRTPGVDAPSQVLSGIVRGDVSRICVLFGSTTPAVREVLLARYRDVEDYLRHYELAVDAAIGAGFALHADRDALLADATPDVIAAVHTEDGAPR